MQARAFREGPESTPNGGTVTAAATAAFGPKPTYGQLHLNLRRTGHKLPWDRALTAVNDNFRRPGTANAYMLITTLLLVRLPNAAALVTMDWNSADVPTPSIASPK